MAIGSLVDYESTFKYELTHPIEGHGLGVFFELRSAASAAAKAVMRKHMNRLLKQNMKKKEVDIVDLEQQERDKLAATIAGWDWGEQELTKGDGAPEFTPENVNKALEVDWIFAQINQQVNDLENFT